jgi:hypothetical protein
MQFIWRTALAGAILCILLSVGPSPAVSAADRPVVTVDRTIALVRAALASKQDDKQTAKALSKVALAERLDPVVVEYLESEGAGPRTLEELVGLADATAELPPPTPPPSFSHPPVPSRDEMMAAIHHARVFAANYANNLPDFLCEEGVVRYEELRGRRGWEKRDTLGLKLGYEDGQESDKLVSFNGRTTSRSLESVGGAQTNGEFGGLMFQILDPASNGKFRWDHWTLLRKRPTQVYSYRIDPPDSHYKLVFGTAYTRVETIPAMEGMLYLDGETNDIVRIANRAADIEPGFPVLQASTVLDYAEQEVGGKKFPLPLRAETRLATADIHTRNMVEFSGYRKFEGKSTISFGDEAPPTATGGKIKH